MKTNLKISATMVAFAALISACGGGGGGTSVPVTPAPVATTPETPAAPVVTPGNLQTTVPALTYGAASSEYEFVTALNEFRAKVGLGLLAQSDLLDKSAANHLSYVLKNDAVNGGPVNMRTNDPATGRSMFHIESATYPLFTGVQEADRARFVGYTGTYVGEELAFGGGKGGRVALESLAATIYHRAGLMFQGLRDVGVAVGSDASQTFVLEFGYVTPQTTASDFLGVYPADKQTSVGLHTYVEVPNPFPELSLSNADFPTKTGYPVSVISKEGTRLEVVSFTITEAGAGMPLSARVMTSDNDPNRYLASNIAFLIANEPLKSSTTYTIVFSGRINNSLVNKTWSFTTK
jgi:uncharacterized protein YkwD